MNTDPKTPRADEAQPYSREERAYQGEAQPTIRTAEGENPSESRTIEGYAVIFNQRSQVLCSWGERFEEIIHPSAISEDLLQRSDIKALMEHNRERLLARSNKGVGTLRLSLDAVGLRYSFEAPHTTDGATALELVKRGDIAGSSFAFRATSEGAVERHWDAERKLWVYEVRKIDALYDVTLTSDPAYQQTSVSARSLTAPNAPEPCPTVQLDPYYERLKQL